MTLMLPRVTHILHSSEKGRLPDEIVQACEDTWKEVKGVATKYWAD